MAGGADMLAGLAAGAPKASPEDLLVQIRQLLDQYLAVGPNTPVAAEAQGLAQAIDSQAGAGDAAGAPDPNGPVPQESTMALSASTPDPTAPDPTQLDPGLPAGDSGGDAYKKKRAGAKAFLKGQNAKAKA